MPDAGAGDIDGELGFSGPVPPITTRLRW